MQRESEWEENSMVKPRLVTGLFKTRVAAETAVNAIIKRGYSREEISVLMSDATKNKEFGLEARSHTTDGAVLAAIAAVGTTIMLPGIGIVIAGPIAAALVGAGAGGAAGGLIGALIGAGIPEHRARVYDAGIRGGGILIGVETRTGEEVERLETLLAELGGENVRQA
jgi:hypothetical protein